MSRDVARHLVGTLVFTLLLPATIAVYIPSAILPPSARATVAYGLAPMLAGVFLYLACAWNFVAAGRGTPAPVAPPRFLVRGGPYRYVRNPMYHAVLLILAGETLAFRSSTLGVYTGAVAVGFHLFVVGYEEPTLRRKFGDSYLAYCASVPRSIPRTRPGC